MSMLARHAYQRLVDEDLGWLERQERTLERDHVCLIVRRSPELEYGVMAMAQALGVADRSGRASFERMLSEVRRLQEEFKG